MYRLKKSPIFNKKYKEAPAFTPERLLRESRRQKSLVPARIPEICLLDPDGDIVKYLLKEGRATLNPTWACYHTALYDFTYDGIQFGVIGGAVGASFAALVAEELFACGCKFLISMTSAGQILPLHKLPYFVLIKQAVRDEGTSYHYVAPAALSRLAPALLDLMKKKFCDMNIPVEVGTSWTTDAPFRETASAIKHYRSQGVLAVEMEAAALYAFARAKRKNVVCFAHITNQMGKIEGDFEKGLESGSVDALRVVSIAARSWLIQR